MQPPTRTALALAALTLGAAAAAPQDFDPPDDALGRSRFAPQRSHLLFLDPVHKDLKLTAEQSARFAEVADAARKAHAPESQRLRQQQQAVRDRRAELERKIGEEALKALEPVLGADVVARARQIERQGKGMRAVDDPEVARALNLTDAQRRDLKRLAEELGRRFRDRVLKALAETQGDLEAVRERLDGLDAEKGPLTREFFERAAALLGADQQKTWKQLFGEPSEAALRRQARVRYPFSAAPELPPARSSSPLSRGLGLDERVGGLRGGDDPFGGFRGSARPGSLAADVVRELKVAREKLREAAEAEAAVEERFAGELESLAREQRALSRKSAELEAKAADEVYQALERQRDQLLTPGQAKRYRQIELQQRGLAALEDPRVQAELELTLKQAEAIKAAREAPRRQPALEGRGFADRGDRGDRGAFGDRGMPGGRALRDRGAPRGATPKEVEEKVLAVLTKEQRQKWQEMLGPPLPAR
jgi:hypothetical protein